MAGQWGRKRETTWGVPVVVDDFYPVENASVTVDPGWMRPKGIRAGRRTRNPAQRGRLVVKGNTKMELLTTPSASILLDLFGAVSGSGPLTFTPGSANESFTSQAAMTDSSGTVRPVTAYGCKIDDFTLAAAVGEYVTLDLNYTAKNATLHRSVADGVTTNTSTAITSATGAFTASDVGRPITGTGIAAGTTIAAVTSATAATLSAAATATGTSIAFTIGIALASASYSAGVPWTFVQASLTAAGSTVGSARSFSLQGRKNLRNDRHHFGDYAINEQLEDDRFDYATTVEMDFESNAFSILTLSAGQAALVFSLSDAADGGTNTLVITQNVQVSGDLPSLTRPGLEAQSIKFEAGHATSDASAITAVLTNAETSAA